MTCVKDSVHVYRGVCSPVNSTVYDLLLDLHAVEPSIDFGETGDSADGLPEQAVGDGEHVRLVDNGDLLMGRINVYDVSQLFGKCSPSVGGQVRCQRPFARSYEKHAR